MHSPDWNIWTAAHFLFFRHQPSAYSIWITILDITLCVKSVYVQSCPKTLFQAAFESLQFEHHVLKGLHIITSFYIDCFISNWKCITIQTLKVRSVLGTYLWFHCLISPSQEWQKMGNPPQWLQWGWRGVCGEGQSHSDHCPPHQGSKWERRWWSMVHLAFYRSCRPRGELYTGTITTEVNHLHMLSSPLFHSFM